MTDHPPADGLVPGLPDAASASTAPSTAPSTTLPGRSRRRRVAALAAAAVVVLAGAVVAVALTRPSSGPAPKPGSTVTDPQAVYDTQAARLKTLLDGLAAGLPGTAAAPVPVIEGPQSCAQPFLKSTDEFPRAYSYGLAVELARPDTRAAGEAVLTALAEQGWTIRRSPAGSGELRADGQKAGAVVTVTAGQAGTGMRIIGETACIRADGTLDTGYRA